MLDCGLPLTVLLLGVSVQCAQLAHGQIYLVRQLAHNAFLEHGLQLLQGPRVFCVSTVWLGPGLVLLGPSIHLNV